jgi:hypothetical protein
MCFKDFTTARSVSEAEAGFVNAAALKPSAPVIPPQEFCYRSKP